MGDSLWVVRPPQGDEAAECERLHRLAIERRWAQPSSRGTDRYGPRAWLSYWQAKEYEAMHPGTGRPVPPHTPGAGPWMPEDESQMAARIAANLARWAGWPFTEGSP